MVMHFEPLVKVAYDMFIRDGFDNKRIIDNLTMLYPFLTQKQIADAVSTAEKGIKRELSRE